MKWIILRSWHLATVFSSHAPLWDNNYFLEEGYGQFTLCAIEIHFSLYIEQLILQDSSDPLFLRENRKVTESTIIAVIRVILSASMDTYLSPPLLSILGHSHSQPRPFQFLIPKGFKSLSATSFPAWNGYTSLFIIKTGRRHTKRQPSESAGFHMYSCFPLPWSTVLLPPDYQDRLLLLWNVSYFCVLVFWYKMLRWQL